MKSYKIKEIFRKVFIADEPIKHDGCKWKVSLQFLNLEEDLELFSFWFTDPCPLRDFLKPKLPA